MKATIKLQTDSILHIPLNRYEQDFTFIVNGEEFKMNKIISHILSQNISKFHLSDPTIDAYSIKTNSKGDFSHFLNLINFKTSEINENEIPFFNEIIQILETTNLEFKLPKINLTLDNIIDTILQHQNYCDYFKDEISNEIDFLSSQIFEFKNNRISELQKIPTEILERVFNSSSLQVEDEDQFLRLINGLYEFERSNCVLYSFVLFSNVSVEAINEFISIFNFSDMTSSSWKSLSKRLSKEVKNDTKDKNETGRYKMKEKVKKQEINEGLRFEYKNQDFDGIFNYLKNKSSIDNEVNMSFSSLCNGNSMNIFQYGSSNRFGSSDYENSWLRIELKNHQIIPTNYTIKTSNIRQPKNWVIEGSNNCSNWEIIDKNQNCSFMNGDRVSHTFNIDESHHKKFKYLQIRQTSPNWGNSNHLMIESIEFYGFLI